MYQATQDAMTAQICYRQHRLGSEFRRGVRSNTRRWNHAGPNAKNMRKCDGCQAG